MNKCLNEKTEKTEKNIHLAITTLCDRNCPYCCNNCYSWDEVTTVTKEELGNAENIFLTGGEPFAYGNPVAVAKYLRMHYPNIRNIYVYTNAIELVQFLKNASENAVKVLCGVISGLNISIKNKQDRLALLEITQGKYHKELANLNNNRIYVFPAAVAKYEGIDIDKLITDLKIPGFTVVKREWQKEFKPADDSIFRRV